MPREAKKNPREIPHQNRLLSLAALFQGDFSIDWLVELADEKPSQILMAMEGGTQKGWLKKKGPGIFVFADTDKLEVLRDQLEQAHRDNYHRKISDLLIRELPDDDQKPLSVADHLLHITNDIKKCNLLMQAGDLKLKSFQNEAAVQCYNKILEDLSGVKDEASHGLFIETAIRYSKLSMARYDTRRVLSILHEAMDRAKQINRPAYQAILKMYMAKNEWLSGQGRNALQSFEEAWAMAQKIDNPQLLRAATVFRIFFYFWQGRYRNVLDVFEATVPDVERMPHGSFPLLAGMMAGYCYWKCGHLTQGMGMIDSIRSYCRARGDNYVAVYADNCMAEIMLNTGRREEAIALLESVAAEAVQENITWMWLSAKMMLAYAYYLNGDFKKASAYLREHTRQAKQRQVVTPSQYTMELCWAMEQKKLPQIEDLSINKLVAKLIRGKDVFGKGTAYRYQAIIQREKRLAPQKIVRSFNQAIKYLQESGNQLELAKTRLELARQYLMQNNEEKAREIMNLAVQVLSPIEEDLIPDDLKFLISTSPKGEDLLKEILQLGQEAVTIRDNRELVQHIITTVNRITGAERGALFLLDRNTYPPKLELRASKGITVTEVDHQTFQSSMEVIQKVALSGDGCIIGEDTSQNNTKSCGQIIRSRICVPLILRDQMIGVLYHDNRLFSSAFKETDLELLAYFASQAAIALDNSEAYQKIQQRYRKVSEEKLYFEEQHLQSLHFEDIVGETPPIQRLLAQIEQVAGTDTTVLILGETGVGKELVASAIHRHSHRRNGPFIRVHCSALPDSLIPSELFGHEKGAFTGATQQRIGRFELAHRGTIFLDEIGDLNQDVQVRLLRVLQSKEFERLGGAKTLKSDFRLIAATNRSLEKLVEAEKFRADLYYRLNVFPIHVPPVRERLADVPLLAHYFLKIYSDKMGKSFRGISEEELQKLLEYDWPGNVRELENVIERGTILSRASKFTVPGLSGGMAAGTPSETMLPLKEVERRHILKVLHKTSWRIRGVSGAAEILEVKPTTLEFRMQKLGIQRPNLNRNAKQIKRKVTAV